MTKEELEIAKAAYCVGKIWDIYEGKENFDHMVGLRVKHLIELMRNYQHLSLARDQFIKDGYVIENKAFHNAVENISDKHLAEMSVQYSLHCKVQDGTRHAVMNWSEFQKLAQKFIDIGKAEAVSDIPESNF